MRGLGDRRGDPRAHGVQISQGQRVLAGGLVGDLHRADVGAAVPVRAQRDDGEAAHRQEGQVVPDVDLPVAGHAQEQDGERVVHRTPGRGPLPIEELPDDLVRRRVRGAGPVVDQGQPSGSAPHLRRDPRGRPRDPVHLCRQVHGAPIRQRDGDLASSFRWVPKRPAKASRSSSGPAPGTSSPCHRRRSTSSASSGVSVPGAGRRWRSACTARTSSRPKCIRVVAGARIAATVP